MARSLLLLLALGSLFELHFAIARPWLLHWGATAREQRESLPGDELVPRAVDQTTRAITIDAPAARVFGWVAQLGQDRAGFYSYDLLENLAGCEMPRIERFEPALQQWHLGQKLWMYPQHKLGGVGGVVLLVYEPGRVLGFGTRQIGTQPTQPEDGSWVFVVRPIDDTHTRLLVRGRGAGVRGFGAALFTSLVFEQMHFVMERRTLTGIRTLATGGHTSALADGVQVGVWTLSFGAFVASAVLVLFSRKPSRHLRYLATFVLSGALFQWTTLVQPAPWIGVALCAFVLLLMLLPLRARAQRARDGATSLHVAEGGSP